MISQQDVAQLPLDEKLTLMETLWEEISRIDENVEVPKWHRDVLDERELKIQSGEAKFLPWDDAKRQIDEACR